MGKVLLVEDDQFKKQRILELLVSDIQLRDVFSAGSVMSAIEIIDTGDLGLLILDLAIPDYDEGGEGTQGLGGVTVFRYLHQIDANIPVLVITQFELLNDGEKVIDIATIRSELEDEFGKQFIGLVQYQPTLDGWKKQLISLIRKTGVA